MATKKTGLFAGLNLNSVLLSLLTIVTTGAGTIVIDRINHAIDKSDKRQEETATAQAEASKKQQTAAEEQTKTLTDLRISSERVNAQLPVISDKVTALQGDVKGLQEGQTKLKEQILNKEKE